MILVAFRSRARHETLAELEKLGLRMYELATQMPGFVSYKDFAAADGEIVSLVQFESMEDCKRWRDHAEHRAVQQRARDVLLSEFSVQVCELVRETKFP
jgi:heme-degrading monooxygenase HmoA